MTHYYLAIFSMLSLYSVSAYTVAVVGAHGGLGRELVAQSLQKHWKVYAVVRRNDPMFKPCRSGWLEEDETVRIPLKNKHMHVTTDFTNLSSDAIVFTLSGSPFKKDESYLLVREICSRLPPKCKKVCLVSAYGVGDSIKNANIGIKAMNSWYLKDVYSSKQIQENTISNLPEEIDTVIFRPKVLSYDKIPFNPISTTRQDLARQILDWID